MKPNNLSVAALCFVVFFLILTLLDSVLGGVMLVFDSCMLSVCSVVLLLSCLNVRGYEAVPVRKGDAPVIGYRAWCVLGGMLYSFNSSKWYENVPMVAGRTMCSDARRQADFRPDSEGAAGVYAWKTVALLVKNNVSIITIHGEVNLWGHIVEHELGYRAQFAYPRRLVDNGPLTRAAAKRYGVPLVSRTQFWMEGVCRGARETCTRIRRGASL